jgi:ElaB/YqjD/DUF883 family membrane-anchored ribosome-binding protein
MSHKNAIEDIEDRLESILDLHTVEYLLDRVSSVCMKKAQHLRENWQDQVSARAWETMARSIDRVARTAEKRGL